MMTDSEVISQPFMIFFVHFFFLVNALESNFIFLILMKLLFLGILFLYFLYLSENATATIVYLKFNPIIARFEHFISIFVSINLILIFGLFELCHCCLKEALI